MESELTSRWSRTAGAAADARGDHRTTSRKQVESDIEREKVANIDTGIGHRQLGRGPCRRRGRDIINVGEK